MELSQKEGQRFDHEDGEERVPLTFSTTSTRSPRRVTTRNARDGGGFKLSGVCSCCYQGICRYIQTESVDANIKETTNEGKGGGGSNGKNTRFHLGVGSFNEDVDSVDADVAYGDVQDVGTGDPFSGGRIIRRGNERPKFVDASTPTLIDELDVYEDEEEEEEMVKLEYERIRRNASAPIGAKPKPINLSCFATNDGDLVRRTPGARMYQSNYDNQGSGNYFRSNSFDRESMRRTPGATVMHASTVLNISTQQPQDLDHISVSSGVGNDSTGLGFGLTLSSPITKDNGSKDSRVRWRENDMHGTRGEMHKNQDNNDVSSAVTNSTSSTKEVFVSTWSMTKNRHQQQSDHQLVSGRAVYSPNTLRLTEDLGNLLLEDDEKSNESQTISQFSFLKGTGSTEGLNKKGDGDLINGSDRKEDNANNNESWTTPFIVKVEQQQQPSMSRVPRNSFGRGRKSRLERAGRARGGLDKSANSSSLTQNQQSNQNHQRFVGNSFLPYAQQPTPIRKTQSYSFGGKIDSSTVSSRTKTFDLAPPDVSCVDGIAIGGSSSSSFDYIQHRGHPCVDTPILNFGGAFSPPTKVAEVSSLPFNHQHRSLPHPPMAGSFIESNAQGNSGFDTVAQCPFPTGTPTFGGSFSNVEQHQISTQPFFHQTLSFGQSLHPPFGPQHSQNPMFTNVNHPSPVSRSPTLNFQQHHDTAYQINTPACNLHQHHPLPSSEFMSNVNLNHVQPAQPHQFMTSPQLWTPSMSVRYEGLCSPNLDHYDHSSAYSSNGRWQMQQQKQTQHRMHSNQQHAVREASSGSIVVEQPIRPWNQEKEGTSTNGLLYNPLQRKSPIAMAVGRPPSRGKNHRRNFSRKWSNKNQQKHSNALTSMNEKASQRIETVANVTNSPSSTLVTKKTSCNNKSGKKKSLIKEKSSLTQVERSVRTPAEDITDQPNAVPGNADCLAEAKRAELSESPATRSAFKDFYRKLRAEERISFGEAEKYAMASLSDGTLPESIHWRIYLELADLAKRSNKFEEARNLYQKVYKLQPYASQGWLEYSKLEEECGNMNACAKILFTGLEYCEYSENLLTRAIKHEERRGNLSRARELLSRLKHVGIEKVWRTVLEGAMLEARAGNDVMARRVLKYLMHHVPWYGPLYLEAYKLEKDLGHSKEALAVVERGLAAIPRYGPLWFGAFRLCEELDLQDQTYRLPQSMAMIDRATFSISKELIWKVHLEAAQMLERSSTDNLDSSTDPTFLQVMEMSRKRFALTMISCPPNLRWKVWLAAGRMEVAAGNSDVARRLFLRAHSVVPDKGRAVALLECARLEEFVGDVELASAILCRSRNVGGSDWKVWLESVMLSIRNGNYSKAIALSQKALKQHSGTGRLWASLIQLRHLADVEEAQFESLALALNAVPKSGEVWCEGARIHLNPFSRIFDIYRANRHLCFATKFTPQYGDGFLETLRLLILDQLLLPIGSLIWEETKDQLIVDDEKGNWDIHLIKYIFKILIELNSIREYSKTEKTRRLKETPTDLVLLGESSVQMVLERLHSETSQSFIDISRLELRCANADPNYGPVWFHCRSGPTETARNVLARAVKLILDEVKIHANLYITAFIRRFALIYRFIQKGGQRLKDESTASWEKRIDEELLSSPTLKHIIDRGTSNTSFGVELLESSTPPSSFIAGVVELSHHHPIQNISLSERRKVLFGENLL